MHSITRLPSQRRRALVFWYSNCSSSYPAELPALRSLSIELAVNLFFNAARWEELVLDVGQVGTNPEDICLFSLKSFLK